MMTAVVSASAAAWLLLSRGARIDRLHGKDATQATPSRWRLLGTAALIAAAYASMQPTIRPDPHLIVVAATAVGVAWAGVVLVRRGRHRLRRAERRRQVVDLCDGLVAELQAGQPPSRALTWVARAWPELSHASSLALLGGDVPAAMRRNAASQPGSEPLTQIAAGWDVAHRSGAGLADVLDRLSCSLRDDEDVRREVSASLGPTRATGRLLAILPLFGLGLGVAMGADPLAVLLGTTLGSICLALGAAFAVGGLFWVERITDRADPW